MNNNNLNNIKNSGFKVPDNYFQELEYTILAEAKLKSLVNDSGYAVPDGYIENFKITPKEGTKVISIFNKRNIFLASSVAATIILFFSLTIFKTQDITFDALATETIDDYILDEVEVNDLAALFTNEELNETQFIDYDLSEDTLNSYMESIETNDLILE